MILVFLTNWLRYNFDSETIELTISNSVWHELSASVKFAINDDRKVGAHQHTQTTMVMARGRLFIQQHEC